MESRKGQGQAIMKTKSSFDRIKAHLATGGAERAVPASKREDLEMLVRRVDEVRSLGREYGEVELSPYMSSLLRVSTAAPARIPAVSAPAVASV